MSHLLELTGPNFSFKSTIHNNTILDAHLVWPQGELKTSQFPQLEFIDRLQYANIGHKYENFEEYATLCPFLATSVVVPTLPYQDTPSHSLWSQLQGPLSCLPSPSMDVGREALQIALRLAPECPEAWITPWHRSGGSVAVLKGENGLWEKDNHPHQGRILDQVAEMMQFVVPDLADASYQNILRLEQDHEPFEAQELLEIFDAERPDLAVNVRNILSRQLGR